MVHSSSISHRLLKVVGCLAMTLIIQSNGISVSDCGKTKGCVFAPKGCSSWDQSNSSCLIGVTFNRTDDQNIYFELVSRQTMPMGSEVKYMALGFSSDAAMGNEPVVACVFPSASLQVQPVVSMSYNYITGSNRSNSPLNQTYQNYVHYIGSSTLDGLLYCNFSMGINASNSLLMTTYLSQNASYYPLLATGMATWNMYSQPQLQMHSLDTSNWYPFIGAMIPVFTTNYSALMNAGSGSNNNGNSGGSGGNGAFALVNSNGLIWTLVIAIAVFIIQYDRFEMFSG